MPVEFQKTRENERDSEREQHDHQEHQREEFELVPLSPLRRMEKRIDNLEHSKVNYDSREFYKEMVDIVRMNQQLVDELAKANDALRIEISRLPARIEELVADLKELLSYIKASASEDQAGIVFGGNEQGFAEGMKPLAQKLDVLIDTNKKIVENNAALLNVLEEMDNKMRRVSPPMPPAPPVRRPMPPASSTQ